MAKKKITEEKEKFITLTYNGDAPRQFLEVWYNKGDEHEIPERYKNAIDESMQAVGFKLKSAAGHVKKEEKE